MTSPDLPGGGSKAPRSRSNRPPRTRVEPAPARPEPAGGRADSARTADPDATGKAPTDLSPASTDLPTRRVDGAAPLTDPPQPRRDPSDAYTDPRGLRTGTGDLAGSLASSSAAQARAPSQTAPRPAPAATRGPRQARLSIRRIDPWSVLKFTFVFSLCMLVIGVVAVAALYYALDRLEVFDSLNKFIKELTQNPGTNGQPSTGGLEVYFRAKTIIGGAAVLGGLNAIVLTALATLGAFLYNLCADIVGGIDVVLAERD